MGRIASHFLGLALAATLAACDFLPFLGDEEEVRIGRDERGMAHVYADSLYGLYYGYGYSIAEDRLFQLDSTLRTVRGRASEAFGSEYLETDKFVLRHTDYPSITAQISELAESEPQAFEMLEGFTAGINAYIGWTQKNPGRRLPGEYEHFGLDLTPWTLEDVVMLYVGTMAYRYADFNNEMDNLAFLRSLEESHGKDRAWAIFNAAHPREAPNSPTTIPYRAKEVPTLPPSYKRPDYLDDLRQAEAPASPLLDSDGAALADWRDSAARQEAERLGQHWRLGRESASNAWLMSSPRLSDAKAVLVNGPQFGFANPSYVYGIAMHGPDLKAFGNSLYGYPNLLFAHNGKIGWGSTAGFGDQVDVFQLDIHHEKPDHYYYDGRWRPIEKRAHSIAVKGGETVEIESHWTAIGPVSSRIDAEDGSVIYVRRRGWQGESVRSLVQWLKLPLAQNQRQFTDILSRFSLSINFYYIDSDGGIGYIHGGAYPQRSPKHDNRLPVALGTDGGRNWQGMRPFDHNPQLFEPEQHYIANWNNRPSLGWINSDLWWVKWSVTDRVGILHRDMDGREQLTVDEAWGMVQASSYADINYPHLRAQLDKTLNARANQDLAAQLRQALQSWDSQWRDDDTNGYYDSPACAWMQAWLPILLDAVFADDIPASQLPRFVSTGYPIANMPPAVSDSYGLSILARALATQGQGGGSISYDFLNGASIDEIISASVDKAMAALVAEHGDIVADWRLPNPGWQFNAVNFRGVPTGLLPLSGSEAPMNRGSENNIFIARDGKIIGHDVVPPSQDAYKTDQVEAFLKYRHFPLGEETGVYDFENLKTHTLSR